MSEKRIPFTIDDAYYAKRLAEEDGYYSRNDEYPAKSCEKHPHRMWEWDGYGWVCAGCVLGHVSLIKATKK